MCGADETMQYKKFKKNITYRTCVFGDDKSDANQKNNTMCVCVCVFMCVPISDSHDIATLRFSLF